MWAERKLLINKYGLIQPITNKKCEYFNSNKWEVYIWLESNGIPGQA